MFSVMLDERILGVTSQVSSSVSLHSGMQAACSHPYIILGLYASRFLDVLSDFGV